MKNALALLSILCALALPARAQEMRLTGQRSGIKEARTAVARTQAEFEALYKQHDPAAKALPAVDFEKEIVVAVFLGERRTGGTKVELTLMNDPLDGSKLVVFWKEVTPSRTSFGTQVITSPYEMRAVPKRAAVTFERNLKARALVESLSDFPAGGFDCR